jgi:nucleotide-binding universal stress UspA family protein
MINSLQENKLRLSNVSSGMNYEIKKILVPVDLGEASLNALETAAEIAKRKNASLHVLNVFDDTLDFYASTNGQPSFSGNSKYILTALVHSIQRSHGIEPEIDFEKGVVPKSILKTAFTRQFDLIILGTHGESGYRNNYIGSTAYTVVKYSDCPVLLIPPTKKISTFKKALFPIRPAINALAAYNVLCHFLSAGSKLEIAGLAHTSQEKTKLLDSLVNEIQDKLITDKISPHTSWLLGNGVAENISDAINQLKSDLLVITSAIDITTKSFFVGPHTQDIINTTRIPVLCIKKNGSASFA